MEQRCHTEAPELFTKWGEFGGTRKLTRDVSELRPLHIFPPHVPQHSID